MSAESFEKGMARALRQFQAPQEAPRKARPVAAVGGSMVITYVGRRHDLAPDRVVTVIVPTISRLQGRITAEQDARDKGLKFGHIRNIRMESPA